MLILGDLLESLHHGLISLTSEYFVCYLIMVFVRIFLFNFLPLLGLFLFDSNTGHRIYTSNLFQKHLHDILMIFFIVWKIFISWNLFGSHYSLIFLLCLLGYLFHKQDEETYLNNFLNLFFELTFLTLLLSLNDLDIERNISLYKLIMYSLK
jgi:hypothetical protein